jgi:RHS repeat-associated protein
MKNTVFALIGLLVSSWATAQTPNTWSSQDYDFYAGDFSGDGLTDILFISHTPSMPSGILLSDGTAPTILGQTWASNYLGIPWSSDAYTVHVGDFNGDGKADIFLQSSGPGDSYLLLTDSSGHISAISQAVPHSAMGLAWSADEHHLVVGDFNGDGRADFFFQPTAPGGTSAVVYADANGQFTSSAPAQSWIDGYLGFNWSVSDANVYAGDFNGDGHTDLLIQAQPVMGVANGTVSFSYPANMNGAVLSQGNTQPFLMTGVQSWSRNAFGVDWSPLTHNLVIADFNGDGRSDVLFQPLKTGATATLINGKATGPIFTTATSPLPADLAIAAENAVLIAGQFAGGSTAGLMIQSASRGVGNSMATNIAKGIRSHAITLPTLSSTSVSIAGIGYPPQSASSPTKPAGIATPAGAAVTPTSAGRTGGQFSVTPTGTANYNIPLWTPPGARGIEPHLALHYASGGPDGPMGPGWSVSGLSAIVRCGKTWLSSGGAPAGVTLSTSDDLCLDGNRLRLTSGTQGAAGSTYQGEIADFSLITAYSSQGNGPQYFIVQGKDGRYYEYGNTADSRIFASGATTPYAWALNKIRDRQNNNMVFTYTSGATALTLAKILYTATPATSNAAPYEVDFNYVSRAGGTTISKYVSGGQVSQANQLDKVTVLSLQPSSTIVRRYQLGYAASPTTNRPLLNSVQECGGSAGTDCIRPTTINYQAGAAGWSTAAVPTGLTGQYGFQSIDLNGDGIPDALYGKLSGSTITWYARIATTSGYGAEISTGMSTSGSTVIIPGRFNGTSVNQVLAPVGSTWSVYTYNGSGFSSSSTGVPVNGEFMAADYDGDGLPDLVAAFGGGVTVRRNTTLPGGVVAFAAAVLNVYSLPNGSISAGITSTQAVDFNGDGRADLLVKGAVVGNFGVTTYYLEAILSNGFSAAATLVPMGQNTVGFPNYSFGDLNGDGCTDLFTAGGVGVSNCAGSFTNVTSASGPAPSDPVQVSDYDGDGQSDLLYAHGGQWYVERSTGSGLAAPVATGLSAPSSQTFFATDRNSDGQLDLMYTDTAAGYAVSYYTHNGVNTPPDLANSITDGFGISFAPSYAPISQSNYTKYSDAVFPDTDFQGPMYVVNQFSASDGTGGTYTNDFAYWGARLNMQGRGFEGFDAVRQHDSRSGIWVLSYYSRQFPYIGSLTDQETFEPDAVTYLSIAGSTYTYKTPGGLSGTTCSSCYFPYVSNSIVYNYEATGSKKGGANAYISYTKTQYTYDAYGNATDTLATTEDTDSVAPASPFNGQYWITEVKNTITNDNSAANWCLGRPSTTTTTKTIPGQAAQTRTVAHTMDYANCRATVETIEPNDTRLKATTTFGFDACGNTNSVSVVGLDKTGAALPARLTKSNFSYTTSRCALPEQVTNALNQSTVTAYNYNLGLVSSETDPNGITASWLYDNFGRKTKETRADGTYTTYTYSDCVAASCWGVADLRFLVYSYAYSSAGTQLRVDERFYDGLDRQRYDELNRVLGVMDTQIVSYDSLGRKTEVTLPYSTSSNGYHIYSYDIANRPTEDDLYNASGAIYRSTKIGYAGQTTTVADPNNNTVTKVADVAGKIRQVTDPSTNGTAAGTTRYTFDPFGNLITIVDADSISSSYAYNIRGFKTSANDADSGAWTFTPDSLNELVSQQDARGQVISFGYDLLGRTTSRTEPESTTATQWTYGTTATAHNIGRITQVTKADGYSEAYTFDNVGRPLTATYTEDATNYTFTYAYNTLGSIDTLTYPVSTSGYRLVLKNVFDAYGYLNQVKDNAAGTVFWTLNSANDSNLPTLETLGNGVKIATAFTPWTNEMTTRTEGSGGSTTNLQNLTYNWDLNGNLHQRIDNRQSLTEQFAYDSMNRLLNSQLTAGGVTTTNLTLTYDAAGNISTKSDVSSSAYVYDTVHKHAVKTAGSWSMTYDANGNMTTRAAGSISYYSYNQANIINYSGNSTQFFYNANHQRWKQVANYSGTTETTHYIGGLLEIMTRGTGATEYRHQIPAGSGTAIYTRRTDGSTGTYYATSDHLGSSDLLTDSGAAVLARESFTPFGARRGSAWTGSPSSADYTAFGNTTRKGFTSHEMLDSVALVHMNGRVNDPFLGRFLSADTAIQSLGATESINPYAYAWNDPLKYVDPSGHSIWSAIIGAVVGVIAAFTVQPELFAALGPYWGGVATAAVGGFVGGFTGALIQTGSLSAALSAGLITGVGAGIGAAAGPLAGAVAKIAVGCVAASSSGNCGTFALATIISAVVPVPTAGGGDLGVWGKALSTVESGIVGGIASRISGQSFADGFSGAAAGYLASSAFTASGSSSGAAADTSASTSPADAARNEDLPTVIVTGSKIGGTFTSFWPRGMLQGDQETLRFDVGYNSFYNSAVWALSFTKYAVIAIGTVASFGGGALAEGSALAAEGAAEADTIAVIGRQVDTAVAKDWAGHTILDLPASEWSIEANDAFIQGAIDARQTVYLASPTSEANLFNAVAGRATVFGRELQQFLEAGYARVGDYLVPPTR